MKRITILGAVLTAFLWVSSAMAVPVTIDDNYIGAVDHGYGDIIGDYMDFNISKMVVDFDNDGMHVDIYSEYLDNIGLFYTQLGDLFISTDGWNPNGTAPYLYDNATNGEDWEYALVLDDHMGSTLSGSASLYEVNGGRIFNSWGTGYSVFRDGQEVRFRPDSSTQPVAVGTWSLENTTSGPESDDNLSFVIDYNFGDVSEYGLHWGMTCGNDVIEGSVKAPPVVPEPATMLLLGVGLCGLAFMEKKKLLRRG